MEFGKTSLKRSLSWLLSLTILLSLFAGINIFAYAADENKISLSSVSGAPGEAVGLELEFSSNEDFAGIQVYLQFDDSALAFDPDNDIIFGDYEYVENGPKAFYIIKDPDFNDAFDSGTYSVQLSFTIKGDAEQKEYPITMTASSAILDTSVNDVSTSLINGSITVGSGSVAQNHSITIDNPITNGSITANPTSAYSFDTITLTVTPNDGYSLVPNSLTVTKEAGGTVTVTPYGMSGQYTFSMPDEAVTVTAEFEKAKYVINTGSYTHGAISAESASAEMGETVTLAVTPAAGGYILAPYSLKANGGEVALTKVDENSYTFTMPAKAVMITASFVRPSDMISLDESSLALDEGESAQLTATIQPDETTNKIVVWASSNSAVAAVSGDGKVVALKEGTATISATPADGGAEPAACEVTVTGIDNPETLVTISDIDDFMEFAGQVNEGESFAGKTVRLMADLDLSTVCGEDAALGNWTPIGISADNPFSGLFDGNGHTISGLYFKNITETDDGKYKALFGFVTDGIIKDLTVEGFVNSYQHAAGIVSQMLRATVSGCINQVEIRAQQTYAGGIAVDLSEGSIVVDCINIAPVTVSRSTFAGGIVSHVSSDSSIINCYNEGTVMSQGTSSGIAVGNNGYIEGCVNVGAVKSASGGAAGIAGGNVGIIANCYNKGAVTATANSTGNLLAAAGIARGDTGNIINCYNIGALSATGATNNAAARCFAIAGTVKTIDYQPVVSIPTVENSYYSESIRPSTGAEMDTTAGVAIESLSDSGSDLLTELGNAYVADIGINGGYPILKWQAENQNADYRITLAHNATAEHGLTVLAAGTKVENGEHFYSGKGGTGLTLTMSKRYTVEEITVGSGTVTLVSSKISGETGVYTYRLSDVSAQSTLTITLREQDKNIGEGGSPIVSDVSESEVWNGTDVNVRWYFGNENATSYTINTAAELAGVAALVNGLVNEDCVVYVSDSESYTAADWNSSSYAKSSGSEDSGGQGSNQSTDIYYYGIENFEGKTIILGDNIDMGAAYSYGSWYGPNYMPLGGQYLMTDEDTSTKLGSSFCGTFDGGGHYVYNIYCDRHCSGNYGDGQSVGLIGRLGVHDNDPVALRPLNPSVRNVAITGYIYANRSVGGIVGKIGKTEANNSDDNDDGGIIENCANFATVKNTDAAGCGGIVGAGYNGGTISNCYNAGTISSSYNCPTAGISGRNEITLQNCYNIGAISAAEDRFAMAIGTNNSGAPYNDSVINCWYLEGSAPGGGYFDRSASNNENAQTSEEMKSENFLNQLGSAFAGDTNNINNGYPLLVWQAATAPETYSVTVDNEISGGSITANPTSAAPGEIIAVTVNPDEGKQLVAGSLQYTADGGANYTEITATDGVYNFVLPAADVTVIVQFEDKTQPGDKIPPVLTPDTTDNTVGRAAEITFTDDPDWRSAINGISVNGVPLTGEQYTVSPGSINLAADIFNSAGDHTVTVTATGYSDAVVTQGIQEIQEAQNPCYLITPREDENFVISENQDGIKSMTVKSGVTGLKYFYTDVTPVRSHNGDETLVFVHLRNEQQLSLNSTCGDFDLIDSGGAGFNVDTDDIVKVYMVDRLTNDIDSNPVIFQ